MPAFLAIIRALTIGAGVILQIFMFIKNNKDIRTPENMAVNHRLKGTKNIRMYTPKRNTPAANI
jgi:hypothetical protein